MNFNFLILYFFNYKNFNEMIGRREDGKFLSRPAQLRP